MFGKYIHLPIFLISFSVGIFFVYIIGSDVKTIYIYPTPENVGETQYKDNAGNCYVYEAVETTCPNEEFKIRSIPVQN